MAAKSTPKARSRRKSKPIPVIPNVAANILFIHPETRKQRSYRDWQTAFRAYVDSLSIDERTLVQKCMIFIVAEPEKRNHLRGSCPIIPFPAANKRLAAKEAQ